MVKWGVCVCAQFMVASHNEDSVKYVVNEIESRGLDHQSEFTCCCCCVRVVTCCCCCCCCADCGVSFGQLLGMCDHVSFPLGEAGFRVYKYVPYGPIREVMPYLIRRAQENGDMLGRVGKERGMMVRALSSRVNPFW